MLKLFQKKDKRFKELEQLLADSDKILIGAGAGLSTAAGLTYSGERFERLFKDYIERYQFTDMYTAGFYPFDSLEEKWGYWARHIWYNRYATETNGLYEKLYNIVKDKDYFVITTNVDHQFENAGFDSNRYFETQGNYGEFQCSVPCQDKVYLNKELVQKMLASTKDCKIASETIPYCPNCGAPLTTHLRVDEKFVQDDRWNRMADRYKDFIESMEGHSVLLLELGVGFNTPTIIRFPFEKLANLPDVRLARFNQTDTKSYIDMTQEPLLFTENINDVISRIKSSNDK